MATKEPTQEIHLLLAAILKDVEAIPKDKNAPQYKFRGIDDAYNALHPIFAKHGVVCLPILESVMPSMTEYAFEKNGKSETKRSYRTIVTMGYRFSGPDGSFVEAKVVGEGMDFGDKSAAKALSAAHKYLLLQTFLIPTSDMADGDSDRFDPTIDPETELKKVREENARLKVMAGGQMEMPEDQERALEAKRAKLQAEIDARGEDPAKIKENPPKDDKKPANTDPAPSKAGHGATSETKPAASEPTEPPKTKTEPEPIKEAKPADSWEEHVIGFIQVAGIRGKKLSELTPAQVKLCKDKWADAYADRIKSDPRKVVEQKAVLAAYEKHFGK